MDVASGGEDVARAFNIGIIKRLHIRPGLLASGHFDQKDQESVPRYDWLNRGSFESRNERKIQL
jgi:hypothetical protein